MSNESARYYIAELEAKIESLEKELSEARKRIEIDGVKLNNLGEKLQRAEPEYVVSTNLFEAAEKLAIKRKSCDRHNQIKLSKMLDFLPKVFSPFNNKLCSNGVFRLGQPHLNFPREKDLILFLYCDNLLEKKVVAWFKLSLLKECIFGSIFDGSISRIFFLDRGEFSDSCVRRDSYPDHLDFEFESVEDINLSMGDMINCLSYWFKEK